MGVGSVSVNGDWECVSVRGIASGSVSESGSVNESD